MLVSVLNLSNLLKYCTRFTDDCFNALLSMNFIYEAARSLAKNFLAVNGARTKAWASLAMAMLTALSTSVTASINKYIPNRSDNRGLRRAITSFGPPAVIVMMSLISASPFMQQLGLERLAIPKTFSLASILTKRPDIFSLPMNMRLLTMIPALLLTMLFYLDQNISIRTVNGFQMKKGEAYHVDMLALSTIVLILSVSGLPWMCGATVQSLTHVRAMGKLKMDDNDKETVVDIVENRMSGFITHTLVLSSVLLLPILSQIPMAVVSGVFLYSGSKMMLGNQFLERLGYLLGSMTDISKTKTTVQQTNIFRKVMPGTVAKYVSIQLTMLSLIWILKSTPSLSIFFPACIAMLMITRVFILPSFFSDRDLQYLDSAELEL